jgi:hypothetical protein
MQLPLFALTMASIFWAQALPKSSYVIIGLGIWNVMIAVCERD